MGQKTVLIMTSDKKFKWITIQIAKVNKLLLSVSKNNDNGVDACYGENGAYLQDQRTSEKTMLRRQRGVFVLDMWLVPYSVSMTGRVVYFDGEGVKRVARVSAPKSPTEGFSRPE